MKTIRLLRKTSQLLFLALLLYLIGNNQYPLKFFLPTDFFLRIDPLAALTSISAGREIIAKFWPAIVVIVSAIIMGKFFCGWVCPLGTTLDLSHKAVKAVKVKRDAFRWHHLKYMLLIIILICALLSFQYAYFFDPMVILTRTATISVFPIFYFLGENIFLLLSNIPLIGDDIFNFYSSLKGGVFPVREQLFFQGLPILLIFIGIVLLEKVVRRFWCRNLCPLGALLGFLGKFSFFGRWIGEDCSDCKICSTDCKMGAIKEDLTSTKAECVLCLNCYFTCEPEVIHFGFKRPLKGQSKLDLSRRRFLTASGTGLLLLGLYKTSTVRINLSGKNIRPPGAVEEGKFLDKCLRCQQCSGVCATTGGCLEPAVSEAGMEGLWTPVAKMREGYCEFNCNLCGQVCPSGAIKTLTVPEKQKTRMGLAFFDRNRCLPYYKSEECLVCEEHCPTADKAIKFRLTEIKKNGETITLKIPYVDESLCIGCGICEYKCPVEGEAGIFITKEGEERG